MPSSPNLDRNRLYSTFTGWSSGNIFASVNVKRMFFHCNAKKPVIKAIMIKNVILFRNIKPATAFQKLAFTHLNIYIFTLNIRVQKYEIINN